jgi:hypothetical protein
VGDLAGGQPPECSKGEGDLGVHREGRVTAGEDQLESLVRERRRIHLVLHRLRRVQQLRLRGQGAIAADAIDRSVARRLHEPRSWVGGNTISWPSLRSDRERLLRGFLGEVEVAEEADQRSEDPPPLIAEDPFEDRYHSTIGRTSTAPPSRAAGTRAAISIAASRSSASNRR